MILHVEPDGTIYYGPYMRVYRGKFRRRQVIIKRPDGTRTSMAYARFLYEQEHGEIPEGMQVDHIDGDVMNDHIDNLQLLTAFDNNSKGHVGRASVFKGVEKGWRHGTIYGFKNKKCECDECRAAKDAYKESRRKS